MPNVQSPWSSLATAIAASLEPIIRDAVARVAREALEATRPAPLEKLLTVAEAAEVAGVHPQSIRRAVTAGRLRAVTSLGRRQRIRREDLDAFLTPKSGVAL